MAPRQVIAVRKAAERAAARQRLGALRSLTVQPATEKRYRRQVANFLGWLGASYNVVDDHDELG